PQTTTTTTTTAPQTTTTTTTTTAPPEPTNTTTLTPYQRDLAAAARMAPDFVMPNDCRPPPLGSPYSMPNAPRAYRSGVHAGVDFLCSAPGDPVVSVLSGQVAVAAGGYVDPTPSEWNELLGVAIALGDTPAYTNAMLSGSYVVVDHGIIDGVGHVVSLYAHLDAVDPGIRVGMRVDAGQRLGGVGNTGTRAGTSGDRYGQLHLHWNFYVGDRYLGAGLSAAETRAVYAELFSHATGTGAGTPPPGDATVTPGPGPAGPRTITPSGRKLLAEPITFEEARAAAELLSAGIVVPSDCGPVPLDRTSALPNAPRPYRSGIHQGIDFWCPVLGHQAVAALAGRVVVAVGDFEDPTPLEWNQLLDTAAVLGTTPPYTLMMLYGNHVAVDHGIIDGVGHVVSLYAHLDGLEPGIRPGLRVEAGQPLGTIGNSGTRAGAAGAVHDQLHLHWELHIDGQYLGIGLSHEDTRAVYTALFSG
ncbi:MAG: M23 family metallopeptidase, partial [Acidimicrobiaceae bacterium]|nr:M23 family metallopeptidase [Acidimicrobiaceae bacterium]